MITNIPHYFDRMENAVKKYWNHEALCDFRGKKMTYGEMMTQMEMAHLFFEGMDIKKGDHIALCAKNCASWALSFLSITTYEAVVVPILVDFKPESVHKLVTHSDSVLLMTDNDTWKKLNINEMPNLKAVINIETM